MVKQFSFCYAASVMKKGRHDTEYEDTHHNDTKHNNIQHNHEYKMWHSA